MMRTTLELFLCGLAEEDTVLYHRTARDITGRGEDPDQLLAPLLASLDIGATDSGKACAHSTSWRFDDGGIIFGVEARAAALLDYADKQLTGLTKARENIIESQLPGVYFMWPQGPLETSGAPSTVNDLIQLAGGRNVAAPLRREHLVVNFEKLLAWQPQVVIMWRNPRLSPEAVMKMPVWQTLPAARSGRIFELPSVFYCDLWTLKFLHAVKLSAGWCHPQKMAIADMENEKRALLVALYGTDKGGRIPLDE